LIEYSLYFLATLVFSTLFAMGGVGSAVVLVSVFPMMGQSFDMSKALALFVNTSSTITASVMNFIRGVLDFKFVFPLVLSVMIATPLGAILSQYVNQDYLRWMLVVFLLVSATLLMIGKKESQNHRSNRYLLYLIGFTVGIVSGMIGVGGGSLIMPLLILLGYDAKKAAYGVSFVIPFSTFGSFLTYLQFVEMDWLLLGCVSIAALIGGYVGGKIMHFKLSQKDIKKLIGVVLYLVAFKMILDLI